MNSNMSMTNQHVSERKDKDDDIDLVKIIIKLWNNRRLILVVTFSFIIASVLYALLAQPYYQSSVTMYQVKSEEQSLSGGAFQTLASQFGIAGIGSSFQYNIPDIVQSKMVKMRLLNKKWDIDAYEDSVDLMSILEIEGENENEKRVEALKKLQDLISVDKDEETGLNVIKVLMPDPYLAAEVANYLPKVIRDFVNKQQKENTKKNLKYIDERLDQVKKELLQAENKIADFKKQNRLIGMSVELQLEEQRLTRQVNIKEQVFTTLKQEKEKVLVQLYKEAPVVNLLDKAYVPVEKEKPQRRLIVIGGAFLGFIVSLLMVGIMNVFSLLQNMRKDQA